MAVNALYLDNWTVEQVETSKEGYRLSARYDVEPDHCPKCGSTRKPYKHGPKQIDYVDAPVHGKRTVVSVEVRRYRCRDCGGTFMQSLPDVHPQRRMMMRCVEHIRDQSLIRPYAHLAREIGLDEKTIRDVGNEEVDRLLASHRPSAPVALGIDELTLHNRKRTIFTDIGERRVLDLIEGMSKPQVVHWLMNLPNRERVRIVTIDMWGPYKDAVAAALPNAIVISDKWHIISKANDTLDAIRNKQRRASKSRKNPHRGRRLLQASRHHLSPQRAFILDGVLKNNPLLSAAWHCKEGFYDVWGYKDRPSRHEAETRFDAWKASIPDEVSEFRAIAQTVDRWRNEVFAYFDHPFTNAYTEAANGLIKIVNRAGRGYRFNAIRARAITMPKRSKLRLAVCEECLGQYPRSPQRWFEIRPGVAVIPFHIPHNPLGNPKEVCTRCSQFHTTEWLQQIGRYTRYSG